MNNIADILQAALQARLNFMDEHHKTAFRLFNGFTEGLPSFSLDIYAQTGLIHNYGMENSGLQVEEICNWMLKNLPWLHCIIIKTREGTTSTQKRGEIIHGKVPDNKILENGVWYAINLTMNRDASLYMDTRNLRVWAKNNLSGMNVLNTFAYTGSLGVAALAGNAKTVIQLDKNKSFLDLARQSSALNGFQTSASHFLASDFFPAISQLKKSGKYFDCIFLDPPFFASTPKGRVDLEADNARLINKVRPLINHNGMLVTINNALFVSGKDYLQALQALCTGGYLQIEDIIPVPEDFIGNKTLPSNLPADPAPFNHSTKIVVLRVKRKSA